MKIRKSYRFVLIHNGKKEPWTGMFESFYDAETWYLRHGKRHEAEGRKLLLLISSRIGSRCISTEKVKPKKLWK